MIGLPTVTRDDQGFDLVQVERDHTRLDSEDWLELFARLIDHGCHGIVIDASQVATPSSPFMSALAWCQRLAHDRGINSCIIGCGERLQRALHITELDRVLLFAPDLDQGRALLQNKHSAGE